jgi:hypothetical protein
MKRLYELLLAAYLPLAMRHMLVEGGFPRRPSPGNRAVVPRRASARGIDAPLVRLFAVQIR